MGQDVSRVTADRARADLTHLGRRAQYRDERFIVTYRGRPFFAIVPVSDVADVEDEDLKDVSA